MIENLKVLSKEEGLHFLGISSLDLEEDYLRFKQWLSESKQAGMQFLEKYEDIRRDPSRLLPDAKCAVILGLSYDQGDIWPPQENESPRIAQYARFKDYHKLFKEKAERIFARLNVKTPQLKYRVCVDTAPLLERALAAKAQQGFIGKNTCYIHESHGSFLLLAVVLCNQEPDSASVSVSSGCESCTLCQVNCPTGALNTDYSIDSRKCLSYWTIEHRGEIPLEFWPHLSKYYFGCDICQLVCPYNQQARENSLDQKIPTRTFPDLKTTALMNEADYQKFFGGTPLTRAKRNGLRRNAIIALRVSKHSGWEEVAAELANDPDPIIQSTLSTASNYFN